MNKVFISLACFVFLIGLGGSVSAEEIYLNNSEIKIGVELDKGGTITNLTDLSYGVNLVNSYDLGRMIQQSYYSGPKPFEGTYWEVDGNLTPWEWNPVAAGDAGYNPSEVIEYSNDGVTLYVKTRPMQWAVKDENGSIMSPKPCNCTFEKWITLENNVVKVRAQLNNNRSDQTQYSHFNQELPAVYTTDEFYRLFTYNESAPFTNDSLALVNKSGLPWASWDATENWAALVNDSDWGLGVFHPGVQTFQGGFLGTGNPTGYITPRRDEIIDWNIVYTYEFYLIVDDLDGIRDYVYQYHEDHQKENLPDYRFEQDRQHWHYHKTGSNENLTTDTGWPIEGKLHVNLDQPIPKMVGPSGLWNATDVPKLYIRAKYNTTNITAKIIWKKFGQTQFSGGVYWNITPDGEFHTYVVNLSSNQNLTGDKYSGMIKQLRFDPILGGGSGEFVEIEYISYKYTIPLLPGWNLISIPLEQSNWSITSVLAPIEGKYNVVFAYMDGGWKRSTSTRAPLDGNEPGIRLLDQYVRARHAVGKRYGAVCHHDERDQRLEPHGLSVTQRPESHNRIIAHKLHGRVRVQEPPRRLEEVNINARTLDAYVARLWLLDQYHRGWEL